MQQDTTVSRKAEKKDVEKKQSTESKQSNSIRVKPRSVKSLSTLRGIFKYVLPYKGLLIGAIIALVVSSAFTLGIMRSLQWVIDIGFRAENNEVIAPYFIIGFGAIGILAISTFLRFLFVSLLGERVVADMRNAVHRHLLGMSPAFFEANRPSEIASRLTADTTLIQSVVSGVIPVALRSSIQAAGAIILIILFDPRLIIAMMLLALVITIPVVYFGRKVRRLSRSSQDSIADVGTMANEAYGAINVVQAFTREKEETDRFSSIVEQAYGVAKKRILARAYLMTIIIFVVFGSLNYGLWSGAEAVIGGSLTGGELGSILALGGIAAMSMASLSEVFSVLQRAAGAAGRITELLATKSDLPIAEQPLILPSPLKRAVQFDNVSFAYPSKPGIWALEKISFDIEPGETVAIVGPSGAGKSTILQLFLRFYDPQEGVIKLDGHDITELDPKSLRSNLAFVPQESVMFAETIEANVRFGRPDASDQELKDALAAANCTQFIEALPEGIKTYLGERGIRLSGGQRQRLAIARAILRAAPILLLDEATSSLDSESESEVQKALDKLMQGRTTLVIAHRLATVRKADKIIVMEEGKIVASGNHNKLIADDGLYTRLANLQFTDALLEKSA